MLKLEDLVNNFCKIVEHPVDFLSPQEHHTESIKTLLKSVYDFTKDEEAKPRTNNALPELIIENFDTEQIWQQQELQNEASLSKMLVDISNFVVHKNNLFFDELKVDEELNQDIATTEEDNEEIGTDMQGIESDTSQSDSDGDAHDLRDTGEISSGNEEERTVRTNKRNKKSIVDDDFFKLDEMEEFLKAEDKKYDAEDDPDSGNDSESDDDSINNKEIDYFKVDNEADDDEDERLLNPRFKDFFRRKDESRDFDGKRKKFGEIDDEDAIDGSSAENTDNEMSENLIKSSFEMREDRLKDKIRQIEETALGDKPWPMRGEVSGENRPLNSLLEEVVEFDIASRPAPVITEKTTLQLDDIIKQRIKDKAFDSVERKEKPVDTPLEYKKKLVLDQEKSKESLAQIYEKEYLQQKEAFNANNEEKAEEEPELHKEIKVMMDSLFKKLDALANYHFTPKPAMPELRIINNLPAINMEEVAPTATSDAKLLAPEEVKNRIKGDIIGKSERSTTDKNRERRKKKRKQHVHAVAKQKKEAIINNLNPGLGNKYSKEKAKKQLEKIIKEKNVDKMDESLGSKAVKSSTAFFTQLQDEVKSQIKGKMEIKKRKKFQTALNAKKLKM